MRSRPPSGRTTRTSSDASSLVLGDPHDAEDVAQDAYLKAFRSWDRFDGTDVRAWLYTIGAAPGVQPSARPAPLARGDRPDRATAMERPVGPGPVGRPRRRSTPSTRSALLLNVVDGYTQAEIAQDAVRPRGDGRELDLARSGDAAPGARPGPLARRAAGPGQPASRSGSANWLSYRSK